MKKIILLIVWVILFCATLYGQRPDSLIASYISLHEKKIDSIKAQMEKVDIILKNKVNDRGSLITEQNALKYLLNVAAEERRRLKMEQKHPFYSMESALKKPDEVLVLYLPRSIKKEELNDIRSFKNLEHLFMTGLPKWDAKGIRYAIEMDYSYKLSSNVMNSIGWSYMWPEEYKIEAKYPKSNIDEIPDFLFEMPKLKTIFCYDCNKNWAKKELIAEAKDISIYQIFTYTMYFPYKFNYPNE